MSKLLIALLAFALIVVVLMGCWDDGLEYDAEATHVASQTREVELRATDEAEDTE